MLWNVSWSNDDLKSEPCFFRFKRSWVERLLGSFVKSYKKLYVSTGLEISYKSGLNGFTIQPRVVVLRYATSTEISRQFPYQNSWPDQIWFKGKIFDIGDPQPGADGGYIQIRARDKSDEHHLDSESRQTFPPIFMPANPTAIRELAEKLNDLAYCIESGISD